LTEEWSNSYMGGYYFVSFTRMIKVKLASIMLLCSVFTLAQKIDGNTISNIYSVPNVKAEELFSKLHFAVALIYQDANQVIKYSDSKKRMLLKATALVPVLDAYKLMNPNDTSLSDYIDYRHNYTLIIDVKDGKYRTELRYQDGSYTDAQLIEYKLPFPAKMDFTPTDLEAVLKKAEKDMSQEYYMMTSRKKKEIYIQSQPRVIKEYQQTLIDYATLFFQSLYKEVLKEVAPEDW